MKLDEFLRIFPMRTSNIMWFLGAGASAAAGICTAYHMIWEFKRRLYCTSQRVPLSSCGDLSEMAVRSTIQRFCDSLPNAPSEDSPEEYSYYFELAFPNEADRRRFIEKSLTAASPSFGHLAMAGLMRSGYLNIVWTTNFDRMVEDAVGRIYGTTSNLVVSSIDSSKVANEALNESRWPLLVKLHGDFQSRRLKNTEAELRLQDETLQCALSQACLRFGLAVVGYSGRDTSVMDVLEKKISEKNAYPSGLFWFHRSDSPPLPRVKKLIENAKTNGIDAHFIEVETFDELLSDILSMLPTTSTDILKLLNSRPNRLSDSPLPPIAGNWPVLRFNAFPIISAPTMCRRIVCEIGGYKEIRDAISRADVQAVVGRRNLGIIAFGDDEDLRKAFSPFQISEFSLLAIDPKRLRYESAEMGIIYEALCRAIARSCPVKITGHQHTVIYIDDAQLSNSQYAKLRSAVSPLCGKIPNTNLTWAEAVRIRLDYHSDKLFLLLEPTIWTARNGTKDASCIKDFVREKLARRFNLTWNGLLDGWAELLLGNGNSSTFRAFNISSGIDAVFEIHKTTAFSRRGGLR